MPESDPIDSEGQRILEVTQKIIDEKDPYRLLNLIVQLNVLLEAKRERLKVEAQESRAVSAANYRAGRTAVVDWGKRRVYS